MRKNIKALYRLFGSITIGKYNKRNIKNREEKKKKKKNREKAIINAFFKSIGL